MMNSPSGSKPGKNHRGVTLLEVSAAMAVLAVFLGSAAHVVTAFAIGERAAEHRAIAQRSVDNLLEAFLAAGPERVQAVVADAADRSSEELARQHLPEPVLDHLPGARLTIQLASETEPLSARRVTLALAWTSHRGQPTRPVRLTGWSLSPQEATP